MRGRVAPGCGAAFARYVPLIALFNRSWQR
jgi:hypothetical protein